MAERNPRSGAQESREVLRDRLHAWWTAVLSGQTDQSHPVHGSSISAHLDGDSLVIDGTVPSAEDRSEVSREVEHLRGKGVAEVRNKLEVKPESTDEKHLLAQTLLAFYETEEQAGFAQGYMEGHAHIRAESMQVIVPNASARGERLRAAVPEAYWEDAQRALDAGRSMLVVTVDETEAFKARELLDEETSSLETVVMPPYSSRDLETAPAAGVC